YIFISCCLFFFFFQAEDGIRDDLVTGVQTCALPIYRIRLTADGQLRTCLFSRREWDLKSPLRDGVSDEELAKLIRFAVRHKELRSEERRVGKECRSRWSTGQ